MKRLFMMSLLAVSTVLSAQQSTELKLWPNGAPNTNGITTDEQEPEKNRLSNITVTTLTNYPATQPNGLAIIMCPGGGYTRLAKDHEGHAMEHWFNTQGITFAVLKFRMPIGHHEVPLSDAEQAIRMVREHAAEWGVNPQRVGIMGASAGGHLAASLATLYSSDKTRPDFQILFYPVISMQKGVTHGGSRKNLIGENPSQELEQKYSLERQVSPRTPQAFIMLSSDDDAVPPINGIGYFLALRDHKVPASLHAYPTGGHGWGFRDNFTYKRQWTEELEKWLREGLVFPVSEPTTKK